MMSQHRKAIERNYKGLMWVKEFKSVEVDGETLQELVMVHEEIPCYLQRSQNKKVSSDGINLEINYDLKIMCAPEVKIKPGSHIRVEQSGMKYSFENTGEPFIYETHQELMAKRGDVT